LLTLQGGTRDRQWPHAVGLFTVIPAQAGIQRLYTWFLRGRCRHWIPACAGMTNV
jgi:hypothetical protein